MRYFSVAASVHGELTTPGADSNKQQTLLVVPTYTFVGTDKIIVDNIRRIAAVTFEPATIDTYNNENNDNNDNNEASAHRLKCSPLDLLDLLYESNECGRLNWATAHGDARLDAAPVSVWLYASTPQAARHPPGKDTSRDELLLDQWHELYRFARDKAHKSDACALKLKLVLSYLAYRGVHLQHLLFFVHVAKHHQRFANVGMLEPLVDNAALAVGHEFDPDQLCALIATHFIDMDTYYRIWLVEGIAFQYICVKLSVILNFRKKMTFFIKLNQICN